MSIEFITGPMFAGKSTYLTNKILNLKKDNNHVNNMLIFNYKNDKRYNENGHLSTHDKIIIESIGIEDANEITNYLNTNINNNNQIKYIIIDEIQFMKNIYYWVILNKNKYHIFISGLNYDIFYNYFNDDIKKIINDANIKKIYLKANCFKCKSPNATYTYLIKTKNDLHLSPTNNKCIGGKDLYQPICINCKNIT